MNSSDTHHKQRSQFLSSINSSPSAPAAPESLDATHVMLYSKKSRVIVSGTYLYSLMAAHVGFSTGGTHMSGCFSWRASTTGIPVFLQMSPRIRHPPLPLYWWPEGPPVTAFLTAWCCGSYKSCNTTPIQHVSGSGYLRIQLSGTPCPQGRWGVGLLQSWL